MVEIKDFADDRGHINWPAFRQARRDAGEECEHCGGTIAKPNGEPTICWNCRMLDPNVVVTDWSTRCPECDTIAAVADPRLYQMGNHSVTCGYCKYVYEVTTRVTYSFESPALNHAQIQDHINKSQAHPQ